MPKTSYSPRRSDGIVVIAAADAQSTGGEVADFVCDGVDDQEELNFALAELPTRGGTIRLSDGSFNLTEPWVITTNKRIKIEAYGAVLKLGPGCTGIFINQGSVVLSRAVVVEGLRIDGGSNTGTIGVVFQDTNWSSLKGVHIENCARGILMHCKEPNEFVEGIALDDVIIRSSSVYGIEYRRTGGTNSFGQHKYGGVYINCGGTSTGVLLPSGCSIYRCRMNIQCWIADGQTAFNFDGDADGASLQLSVEGATGSTTNIGLVIGSNATNFDKAAIEWYKTGTVNTEFSVAAGKDLAFRQGRHFKGHTANSTAPIRIQSHADTSAKITLGLNGTSGGRITFGNGTGTNDGYIERATAAVLAVGAAKLRTVGLKIQTKAGTPVDGDITGGAEDGDIVIDTTASKIWVRIGGTWKAVAVA